MGPYCCRPDHGLHVWPRTGILAIQDCERFCQYCDRMNRYWADATDLRQHVLGRHLTSGAVDIDTPFETDNPLPVPPVIYMPGVRLIGIEDGAAIDATDSSVRDPRSAAPGDEAIQQAERLAAAERAADAARKRIYEAERRAAAVKQRMADMTVGALEKRAEEAEQRVAEAEQLLAEAERRATAENLVEVAERSVGDGRRVAPDADEGAAVLLRAPEAVKKFSAALERVEAIREELASAPPNRTMLASGPVVLPTRNSAPANSAPGGPPVRPTTPIIALPTMELSLMRLETSDREFLHPGLSLVPNQVEGVYVVHSKGKAVRMGDGLLSIDPKKIGRLLICRNTRNGFRARVLGSPSDPEGYKANSDIQFCNVTSRDVFMIALAKHDGIVVELKKRKHLERLPPLPRPPPPNRSEMVPGNHLRFPDDAESQDQPRESWIELVRPPISYRAESTTSQRLGSKMASLHQSAPHGSTNGATPSEKSNKKSKKRTGSAADNDEGARTQPVSKRVLHSMAWQNMSTADEDIPDPNYEILSISPAPFFGDEHHHNTPVPNLKFEYDDPEGILSRTNEDYNMHHVPSRRFQVPDDDYVPDPKVEEDAD